MNVKTRLSDLRARFREHAIAPETLFQLNGDNGIDLVEKATLEGARLAGVEGVLVSEAGAYEPRQDFSNDNAGWLGSSSALVESTKELMRRGGVGIGIRFQVVFEDESQGRECDRRTCRSHDKDGKTYKHPVELEIPALATYLPMAHGFLYLTAILDVFSRKVLAWRLSNTMSSDFCVEALEEAIAKFGVPEIFNTDQGSQFTSEAWINVLKGAKVAISMDGKGAGSTTCSSSGCGAA